jgi:hypothetical protein
MKTYLNINVMGMSSSTLWLLYTCGKATRQACPDPVEN